MLDQLSCGVEIVNDRVSVLRRAGREDTDFIVLVRGHQELSRVRSDVEADALDDLATWRCDVQVDHGRPQRVRLLDTVDKRLIQVEQQKLRQMLFLEFNFNLFFDDLFHRDLQVLQNVDRLVDVN